MLANRVDQLREPVAGDEILPILHRRLLGAAPDPSAASQVAQVTRTSSPRCGAPMPRTRARSM
jgi:hypothetical protein